MGAEFGIIFNVIIGTGICPNPWRGCSLARGFYLLGGVGEGLSSNNGDKTTKATDVAFVTEGKSAAIARRERDGRGGGLKRRDCRECKVES